MEAVADRLRVAEQADEALGEVRRACVSVHSDVPSPWTTISLSAAHAIDRRSSRPRTAPGCGRRCAMGGRSSPGSRRAVRAHEQVLAGDLGLRVRPDRVAQRRGLDDRKPCDWLLVGRRRADEDVLAGASGEPLEVGLECAPARTRGSWRRRRTRGRRSPRARSPGRGRRRRRRRASGGSGRIDVAPRLSTNSSIPASTARCEQPALISPVPPMNRDLQCGHGCEPPSISVGKRMRRVPRRDGRGTRRCRSGE